MSDHHSASTTAAHRKRDHERRHGGLQFCTDCATPQRGRGRRTPQGHGRRRRGGTQGGTRRDGRAADLVIVNGGLGPTIDDLTAEILAEVAGVSLEEHPRAVAHLQQWCEKRNLTLNEANLKQAMLAQRGQDRGQPHWQRCWFRNDPGRPVASFAPREYPANWPPCWMQSSTDLAQQLGRPPVEIYLRLQTFGLGESTAQQIISDAIEDWPREVELGFRAGAPQMEIKLTIASEAAAEAQRAL